MLKTTKGGSIPLLKQGVPCLFCLRPNCISKKLRLLGVGLHCQLLGLSSLVFLRGYDGFVYTISFFIGWPVILFMLAERMRNLGRFTFADIASYRLQQSSIRTFAAFSSLTVVCFYLIVQMVGAGQLIKLLPGGVWRHWQPVVHCGRL